MQGRIWHAGPLFEAVQKAALYKDSKTFVYALTAQTHHSYHCILPTFLYFYIGCQLCNSTNKCFLLTACLARHQGHAAKSGLRNCSKRIHEFSIRERRTANNTRSAAGVCCDPLPASREVFILKCFWHLYGPAF